MTLDDFDPYDNAPTSVDYAVMAELRQECPVKLLDTGFYYFARHDDVSTALRDGGAKTKVFSHLGKNRANGVVVPEEEQLIAEMEGPRHTRLRRLLLTALHPRLIAEAEPYVEKLSNELLDAMEGRVDADLMVEYAIPIPCRVLSHVLGLPEEDHAKFRHWSDEVLNGTYPALNRTERGEGLKGGHPEFSEYMDAIAEDRRRHPKDDLFTRLVEVEVDGDRLSQTEIRVIIALLLIAGNETTSNLIGNLLYRLSADPSLYERVRSDRTLVTHAVEESLRLDPPTLMQGRRTVAECEFRGVQIAEGDRVILGLAAANRDPEVFDHPDEFQLDRENASVHVAFGGGAHFCPGAPLARLEGRVAVSTFLDRIPAVELAPGFEFEKWQVHWANGPQRLPVRFPG